MTYGIGLMTGTSLDGIDVAIIDISEKPTFTTKLVAFETYPYEPNISVPLKQLLDQQSGDLHQISSLNVLLGEAYGTAVLTLCKEKQIDLKEVKFIASHGQTIYHQPSASAGAPSTWQIGESAIIAEMTNKIVVSNFREADRSFFSKTEPATARGKEIPLGKCCNNV